MFFQCPLCEDSHRGMMTINPYKMFWPSGIWFWINFIVTSRPSVRLRQTRSEGDGRERERMASRRHATGLLVRGVILALFHLISSYFSYFLVGESIYFSQNMTVQFVCLGLVQLGWGWFSLVMEREYIWYNMCIKFIGIYI